MTSPIKLDGFRFAHRLRVRWAEVDMQQIVFFGHYITYCDIAMAEYFRNLGYPYPEGLTSEGYDVYVVKTSCEYRGSAQYDDELDIHTRVSKLGRSSLHMQFDLRCGADALALGEIIYAFADLKRGQSVPLPDHIREAVRAFEPQDPQI